MSSYQIKTLHLLIINRLGKAMSYKEIFGKILSRAGPHGQAGRLEREPYLRPTGQIAHPIRAN